MSQRRRERVEEVFGWLKTVGGGRKLRYVGQARNRSWMELAAAPYNLVRMAKLELAPAYGNDNPFWPHRDDQFWPHHPWS